MTFTLRGLFKLQSKSDTYFSFHTSLLHTYSLLIKCLRSVKVNINILNKAGFI